MLPKPNRLTKRKDFERVYKKGKFFACDFLMCKVLENNLGLTRFGIIVGTKISKKATQRNQAKRRLREAIRLKLDKIKKGFDLVVMVKPEIINKTYSEINQALLGLFKKAKLIS